MKKEKKLDLHPMVKNGTFSINQQQQPAYYHIVNPPFLFFSLKWKPIIICLSSALLCFSLRQINLIFSRNNGFAIGFSAAGGGQVQAETLLTYVIRMY